LKIPRGFFFCLVGWFFGAIIPKNTVFPRLPKNPNAPYNF